MRLNRSSQLTAYPRRTAQAALLLLFVGTISLSIGLNLFLSITGITAIGAGEAATQTQDALAGYGLALSIAVYGIVTPLIEEFVFRGMFYSAIYSYAARKTGPASASESSIGMILSAEQRRRAFLIAAGISSLLFAIYHMNIAQGIYAFLMGMAFCLAYELTGQFLSAWILHAACNIIAMLLSQSVGATNAFTQLCTWPWTVAFLAIAIAAGMALRKILIAPQS